MAHTSNVRQRIEAIQRKLFRARLSQTRVLSAVAVGAIAVVLLGGLALTQAEVEPKVFGTEADAPQPEVRRDQLVIHATEAETGRPLEGVEIRFSGWVGGEKYEPVVKADEKGIAIADWDAGAEITTLWMGEYYPRGLPAKPNRSEPSLCVAGGSRRVSARDVSSVDD